MNWLNRLYHRINRTDEKMAAFDQMIEYLDSQVTPEMQAAIDEINLPPYKRALSFVVDAFSDGSITPEQKAILDLQAIRVNTENEFFSFQEHVIDEITYNVRLGELSAS